MRRYLTMELGLQETSSAELDAQLRGFIAHAHFPCLGAKSASATGGLRIIAARDIRSGWSDLEIHRELEVWVNLHSAQQRGLCSLAVIFVEPRLLTELQFEQAMWQRLQSLADQDERRGHESLFRR